MQAINESKTLTAPYQGEAIRQSNSIIRRETPADDAVNGTLIKLCNNIYAPVDSKSPTVECEIVVLGVAPFHIGIEPVIGRPTLVLVLQPLLRGLLPLTIYLDDSFRTEGHICMNKDLQAVRFVFQDIVCTRDLFPPVPR